MALELVDTVWSSMRAGGFYSPADLANTSGQPIDAVTRVLSFLANYGFVDQVTKHELFYRRREASPSPNDTVRVLQSLLAKTAVDHETAIRPLSSSKQPRASLKTHDANDRDYLAAIR